jgi:hypothetical protein
MQAVMMACAAEPYPGLEQKEWMMETAKTLSEMTLRERWDFMSMVADALEWKADDAMDRGNARAAANLANLALSIRGNARELATGDLRAAEILLQQGITLVGQPVNRARALH